MDDPKSPNQKEQWTQDSIPTKIGIFVGVVRDLIFAGQLWEMCEAALKRKNKPAGCPAPSPETATAHPCPNCKSGPTEIYERSRGGVGWICRACNHTWLVSSQSHDRPVVPSANSLSWCGEPVPNSRWTFTIQNTSCPHCASKEFEMRTYGGPWEYADTHCAACGKLIRRFDAA
jgi:ribosomal protein L37AE/L43A